MYGRPLRKLFLQNNLTHLIDFRDIQIFDDATTYTCIIRLKKEKTGDILNVASMKTVNQETLAKDIEATSEEFYKKEMDAKIWVTSSLAKFKLMKQIKEPDRTCSLHTYIKGESYYGIKTGLTEMFLISQEQSNSFIMQDSRSHDILRPFLQGRGLVAYDNANANSYLLYIPKGFTLKGMGIEIDEEELKRHKKKKSDVMPSEEEAWLWFSSKYPAIAEWLIGFKKKAKGRTDKGDYWWELRACDYYDKFEQPKIFYQAFQTKPCFVYDDSSTFCNNSMWFLSISNKALLALLCSTFGWWLISEHCPPIQNGYQLIWDNLRQIPIPMSLPDSLADLATEAEKATAEGNNEKLAQVKQSIDKIVYHLYGLTYDEIRVVDPETIITREEFECISK